MDKVTFYHQLAQQLKKTPNISVFRSRNKWNDPLTAICYSKESDKYVQALFYRSEVRIEQRKHSYDKWEGVSYKDYKGTTLDIVADTAKNMLEVLYDK